MNRLFAYRPTLPQAWGLVALTILVQAVSGLVVGSFIPAAGATQSWHLLLSYVLCFTLMILIVVKLAEHGARSTENEKVVVGSNSQQSGTAYCKLPLPTLFLLLLFFMPALAITIEPLYMWIPMPEWIKQMLESAFKNNVPTFLSAVVAAPLAEEWLCRGVILKGLLTHYPPRKAIIWSAVLFGVLHIYPWQAIPAFCIALAIGWVYWRTQSLWPCIFMHAVNNGMAFLMLLLFPNAASDATIIDIAGSYYGLVYAAALLCGALTGYGLWRMLPGNHLATNNHQ